MKEFKVNKFVTIKLEDTETVIYVAGERFDQCKFLLLEIPVESIQNLNELDSIDEVSEGLGRMLEGMGDEFSIIPPEVEYWAHCSNLQVWSEWNYDSRLLHRNLAFPLLKKLAEIGDPKAIITFKEEIAKRLSSGFPSVVNYLIEEKYIDYLDRQELLYNLLEFKEAEAIHELESLLSMKLDILCDSIEYKSNSIVVDNKHVIRLNLNNIRLEELPSAVTNLRNLKELFITKANLKIISKNINNLTLLQFLNLKCNRIGDLPESIGDLYNLKVLNLEENLITILPESIGNLKNLEKLNLCDNNLVSLPIKFAYLSLLEELWLINNDFKKIPLNVTDLRSLKYLFLSKAKFREENIKKIKNRKTDLIINFY